jgi:2-dehydro-3-deoxyphosphogluconate aldolase / (4S)-4-hydroxy-2-oxoglutarate aldolase
LNILDIVHRVPVIPVLTITDLDCAVPVARALSAGGLTVIEVALRSPVACRVIESMREAVPTAVIGAGTLTRPEHFIAAERAGAQFGVTPGWTPALSRVPRSASFPVMPGVMTPSEVLAANESGFKVLKLYPAEIAGGPVFLSALASVFPDLLFCPTGGITRVTAGQYLDQPNVACVCGSWLVPAEMLAARDWAGIESLARDASTLRASRG